MDIILHKYGIEICIFILFAGIFWFLYMQEMERWKKILIAILSFLIVFYIYFKGKNDTQKLSEKGIYGVARITNYYIDAKGHSNVEYIFRAGTKDFKGGSMTHRFENCENDKKCIGSLYKVKYLSDDPEVNELQLDQPINK